MLLFLAVPWVCLQFVVVVFPDNIHLYFRFAYTICIVKNLDEIYIASETARIKVVDAIVIDQPFLRSLLSVDAADITGLMSGKVKYYVGKLSVSQIPLSMKLSGHSVMSH